jgi:hypothetical protein
MYMKTKKLGWKDNQGVQTTGIEGCQRNVIVDLRQVLKIWDNYVYIAELHDGANRPESLEDKAEDADEKGPCI